MVARGEGRKRAATVIDVAAKAGVSPMTVSRVINNQKGVSAESRQIVQDAIQALRYRPNVAARRLVTSTDLKIGVIYSNPSSAFMSEFLTGVYEEASNKGARLVLLKGEGGRPPSGAAISELTTAGVSGVIVAPPLSEAAIVLELLRKARLPIAAVGAHHVADAICVRIDDRRAAQEMTRELIALGHRRLGFVVGNADQAAAIERLAGFYAAAREVDGIDTVIAQGDFTFGSGLRAGEQLLSEAPPLTAIFASNDDMAAAIVSVAHRRQIDVPRELTVVGFDDTTAAVTLWPPLTTLHQPVRRLAAEALGLLVEEINGAERPFGPRADVVLDHEIVRRQSTQAVSNARKT